MDAGLIPTFGSFAWTIAAFVIALSIIVAIHEYGHYIVGKWSGIKADVFSIGFGPVLASRIGCPTLGGLVQGCTGSGREKSRFYRDPSAAQ